MGKTKTTAKQKAFMLFFSLIITLILIEAGFAGKIISATSSIGFMIRAQEKNGARIYRILALGESTTAGTFVSWPALLEIYLNNKSKNIKFEVYNEGVAGVSTVYILGKLEENIEKYNPDMVITMMGTNDREAVVFEESKSMFAELKELKIYHLLSLLTLQESPAIKKMPDHGRNASDLIGSGYAALENGRYVESELMFKRAIDASASDNSAYTGLGTVYLRSGNINEAEKYFRKALQLNDKDHWAYLHLGHIYFNKKKLNESEQFLQMAVSAKTDFAEGYNLLGSVLGALGKFKESNQAFQKALELDPENANARIALSYIEDGTIQENFRKYLGINIAIENSLSANEVTRFHYRQMFSRLKAKGIRYAAMQYPNLDIQPIKGFFTKEEQDEISFIENNENFRKALQKEPYEKLFLDNFGEFKSDSYMFKGNYGHATEAGNRLIAENAAEAILEIIGQR